MTGKDFKYLVDSILPEMQNTIFRSQTDESVTVPNPQGAANSSHVY